MYDTINHVRLCYPSNQKMTDLYLCNPCQTCFFSDSNALNSEIKYFKVVVVDKGYKPSILDTALFKLQLTRLSCSCESTSLYNIGIVYLTFGKPVFPL